MAKAKHGPSLFEVLRTPEPVRELPRSARRKPWLAVREWFSDARTADEPPAAPTVTRAQDADDADIRWLAIRGRHLTVTLTSRQTAIAVFSFVILLLVAFAAGDRFGQADYRRGVADGKASVPTASDEIAELQTRPPTPGLVDGLLLGTSGSASREPSRGQTPQPPPPVPNTGAWTRGFSYIVIQEFGADRRADAVKAQAYLRGQGIAAEVVDLPGGRFQLITLQGYNPKEPSQKKTAEDLLRRIHDLGTQYYASGGGYKLQGYFKTFKGDSW